METPESITMNLPSPTPSPTPSSNSNMTGTPGPSGSASRRPPRKSTLTQQQKNQKRQRATQDQLGLLEIEFDKNATPTAAVRERIAQEINMTERSVQIWFQNRRAKIKLLAKKSIETGEDCDAIPDSMRQYLAQQAMELGRPLSRSFLANPLAFNGGMQLGLDGHSPQKVVIHHLTCRSLSIGTWRRVGQNAMDLVIFYSLGATPCLTYYINNEAAGYKIEFPFSSIRNVSLENGQQSPDSTMPARPAGILVELIRPPNFFMDSNNQGGFAQCGDFTEDQQASRVLVHHLGGDPTILSGQVGKLAVMDAFRNRHNPLYNAALSDGAVAVSAPVSPIFHRPSSQPNAMGPPAMPMYHRSNVDTFGIGMPPAQVRMHGHKRQRSRSVPAITDFSYLQHPMPSFHIHHPSTTITDPSIFAPTPQHQNVNSLLPQTLNHHSQGNGNGLRIDTEQGFGLDYRQYPQSAATTASASDFASPSLFHAQPAHSTSAIDDSGYSLPMMHSPMLEGTSPAGAGAGIQPSVSPLSALNLNGHNSGDPVIANHSPPLANLHRPASADFLSMHVHENGLGMGQHSVLSDDNLMLNDMYAKQAHHHQMNLPFRAGLYGTGPQNIQPGHGMSMDDSMLGMTGSGMGIGGGMMSLSVEQEVDMNSMIDFGTIDPSQLGTH